MSGATSTSLVVTMSLELKRWWPKPVTIYVLASSRHYGIFVNVNKIPDERSDLIVNDIAEIFCSIAAQYKDSLSAKGARDIFPPLPKEDSAIVCHYLSFSSPRGRRRKRSRDVGHVLFSGNYRFIAESGVKMQEFFKQEDE